MTESSLISGNLPKIKPLSEKHEFRTKNAGNFLKNQIRKFATIRFLSFLVFEKSSSLIEDSKPLLGRFQNEVDLVFSVLFVCFSTVLENRI